MEELWDTFRWWSKGVYVYVKELGVYVYVEELGGICLCGGVSGYMFTEPVN